MITIENLVEQGANIKLEVTPTDLKMFAESIVQRTIMAQQEEQKAAMQRDAEETWLNTKQVRELLNVCDTTLNLWAKRGYLVPVKFGNKNMYTKTDIDRIARATVRRPFQLIAAKRGCSHGNERIGTDQPPPSGSGSGRGIGTAVGDVSTAGAGDYLQPRRL